MGSIRDRVGAAWVCGLLLCCGLLLTLTASAFGPETVGPQSGAPPRETFHSLGTDSNGAEWQARVSVDEPLNVYGPRAFTVATTERFDLFEIHAAIDERDVAWIADGKGRGVRVTLADGKFEEFRVPVSRQLVGGIAVRQGKLFFGDNPAIGSRTVRQLDLASGTVKPLLTLDGSWWPYALVPGRRVVWAVNWTALAGPQVTLELVALEWLTGATTVRAQRSMPIAAYVEATLRIVEAPDGAAWVANGYTERIERLDGSGAWQGWSLDGRSPSNLVAASFGAACVLQRLKPPKDTRTFEGMPMERPTVLSREIAVFVPGNASPLTLPVDAEVRLAAERDGGVRVEGRGRLSVDGGKLQISPGAKQP